MPDHIKFLLKNALFGAIAAVSFVAILLYWNVMNLWHLVSTSPDGLLALVVMTLFFVITFSSVQMGVAVMSLGDEEGDEDRPNFGEMIPIKLPAKTRSDDPFRK